MTTPTRQEELQAMHWQTLKVMMTDAGLEYKSKEQAVEELLKLEPVATEPAVDPAEAEAAAAAAASQAEAEAAAAAAAAAEAEAATYTGPMLNRRMPFGQVFGEIEGAPGARFTQGGHLFNAAGRKVG